MKRADSSTSLSHLYGQAIVAARTLVGSAEARAAFAATVAEAGRGIGRTIAEDFVPKRMVFAILHDKNRAVIPETLFPFAVINLAQIAEFLNGMGIDVEVIGISPTDSR